MALIAAPLIVGSLSVVAATDALDARSVEAEEQEPAASSDKVPEVQLTYGILGLRPNSTYLHDSSKNVSGWVTDDAAIEPMALAEDVYFDAPGGIPTFIIREADDTLLVNAGGAPVRVQLTPHVARLDKESSGDYAASQALMAAHAWLGLRPDEVSVGEVAEDK